MHGVDKDTADLTSVGRGGREFFAGVGAVDILVNNAGGVCGQVGQPLEEVSDERLARGRRREPDQRVPTAPGRSCRAMKERRWGRIVNISSAAGLSVSKTGIQAYTSAKAGQIGFTRQMAHELGPFGITVNCIAPGFILSNPTTEQQWEGYGADGPARAGRRASPCGGWASPADIANGVQFFAAERSSWVTGQIIAIDGGSALL